MTRRESKGFTFVLVFQRKLDKNSTDLRKTVIGDERWCFLCDPETKCQSLHWKITTFPISPKAHMSKSQIKSTLLCVSAICGMVQSGGQKSIHPVRHTRSRSTGCLIKRRVEQGLLASCIQDPAEQFLTKICHQICHGL